MARDINSNNLRYNSTTKNIMNIYAEGIACKPFDTHHHHNVRHYAH